ncbi:MAG: hypothetical protein IJ091_08560 [Oscillospiraceae bacterium]|nr:hypothetical protein [Oscillospiraceae bacterium]
MNKETKLEKIPFDERVRSIERGIVPSPMYVDKIVEEYARMPLFHVLDNCNFFVDRELLTFHLNRQDFLSVDPDVTMDDLSYILYCLNKTGRSEERDKLITEYLSVYFAPLETLVYAHTHPHEFNWSMTRAQIPYYLRSTFDYATITLGNYLKFLQKPEIPPHYRNYLNDYIKRKGCSSSLKLFELFMELKVNVWNDSNYSFIVRSKRSGSVEDMEYASYKDCLPFLKIFIFPIAYFGMAARKNQTEDEADLFAV